MNWYYVDQGKQAGPVDDSQLAQLSAEGRIQEETLVWHEGMANWKPFRDVRAGFAPAPPPPMIAPVASPSAATAVAVAATDAVCAECRNIFPKENMIHYGNSWVCAGCKPVFMQKIAEGVTTMGSGPGLATEADLLARDYDVDIGDSISKGWENFKGNAGILIGTGVIAYIGMMIGTFVNMIVPIPFLGVIVNLLIAPPLRAGLWLTYVKSIRGGPSELNDLFKAFGPRYWQTVLVALIPVLMMFGVMIVFGLFAALFLPMFVPRRGPGVPHSTMPEAALIPIAIVFLVAMCAWMYIATCWLFSMPLVIDKGMRFWPAMELSRRVVRKHWWGTFGLLIVAGLLGISGALACGVGILVTVPVAFAALSAHYEKVFGDLAPQQI